jgi:hypothetical protein
MRPCRSVVAVSPGSSGGERSYTEVLNDLSYFVAGWPEPGCELVRLDWRIRGHRQALKIGGQFQSGSARMVADFVSVAEPISGHLVCPEI